MWTRGILPLLVFIGFHRSNGLPQGSLYSQYGNVFSPHIIYEYDNENEASLYELNKKNKNVDPMSQKDDSADSRNFLLLSHDTTPNSEIFKASETAFLGYGPEIFLKKETEKKKIDASHPFDSSSRTDMVGGVQLFRLPTGPQFSSTDVREERVDDSSFDSRKFDVEFDLFGVPLGKITHVNEKEVNEHDLYGDNDSTSNTRKASAGFELFGVPLGKISYIDEGEGNEVTGEGSLLGHGPLFTYTKTEEELEHDSSEDVNEHEGSYGQEVVDSSPKRVKPKIAFTKKQEVQTYPQEYQGYLKEYQTHLEKQDVRRFLFPGNGDATKKPSAGMNIFGIPLDVMLQYDSRNGLDGLIVLGQPSHTNDKEEPESEFADDGSRKSFHSIDGDAREEASTRISEIPIGSAVLQYDTRSGIGRIITAPFALFKPRY